MALDFPASATALWSIYDQTGVRPEYILPTLWAESGFNPAIQNQQGADYWGINQMSGDWIQSHLHVTPQVYATWPASQQLTQAVLPFVQGLPKPLLSGTRFEQANYLPATVNGGPHWKPARYLTDIVVSSLQYGGTNASANYNKGIDTQNKGYITVADIEAFVRKALPNIQSALQSTYALRPNEVMADPVIGTDPYLGPNPPPSPTPPHDRRIHVTGTNVALAIGGSVVILGAAGLIAWGLSGEEHHGAREENPLKRCPTGSQVQSLVFSRDRFTPTTARRWAANHGFSAGYVDQKPSTLRIRQRSPEGWRRMRTIRMAPGVQAVVGWKRC